MQWNVWQKAEIKFDDNWTVCIRRNLSSLVIQFFSISSPFNKRSATCIFTFGQEKNAIFPPLFDIQHSISYACLSPHQAHDICCGLQHQHLFTRCLNTKVWLRCLENVFKMLTWLTYKSISFGGGKRLEITSLVDKCQACVLLELSTCTLVTKIRAVQVIKF